MKTDVRGVGRGLVYRNFRNFIDIESLGGGFRDNNVPGIRKICRVLQLGSTRPRFLAGKANKCRGSGRPGIDVSRLHCG